jgi:hypothetical protein
MHTWDPSDHSIIDIGDLVTMPETQSYTLEIDCAPFEIPEETSSYIIKLKDDVRRITQKTRQLTSLFKTRGVHEVVSLPKLNALASGIQRLRVLRQRHKASAEMSRDEIVESGIFLIVRWLVFILVIQLLLLSVCILYRPDYLIE